MTYLYEYECVQVCTCTASRKTDHCLQVFASVQMCIDEDLVNRILNKSETIFVENFGS